MKKRLNFLALVFFLFIVSSVLLQASSLPRNELIVLQNSQNQEDLNPIRTINTDFQIKQDNNWMQVKSKDIISEAINGSLANFKSTFFNDGTEHAYLQNFIVYMYNDSTHIFTNYTYSYLDNGGEVDIAPLTTKTQNLTNIIYFPDSTLTYLFSIGFTYLFATNRSNILFASYLSNFTLNVGSPVPPPPELLIIAFYVVTFAIIMHIAIGVYGNRKSVKDIKNPKYHR